MPTNKTDFVWVIPPTRMAQNVTAYGDKVQVAIRALAEFIATKLQNEARQNAPWTDRTGNARSGLFGVVDDAAKDLVTIYLSHGHTIFYGMFLELSNGGKYAIIEPTIEANLPEIKRMLNDLLS